MKDMKKAVERTTGEVFVAEAIDGGFQVYTITDEGAIGEKYKKLKESTFNKNFRFTGESFTSRKEEPTKEEKVEPEKKKAKTNTKKEEPVEELSSDKREKMIEKIKKMIALSKNNPSEEEAMAAALQAQKLMMKYNIHKDDVELEEIKDEITSVFSEQKHNSQLHSWRKQLALIVSRNFRCKCYLQGRDIVFRGYKEDAQLALEIYLMLYHIGDRIGSKKAAEQFECIGTSKGAYNSYVAGFLKGIEDGFHGQCTDLMVIVPTEVEEEYQEFARGFKKSQTNKLTVKDSSLYHDGYEEGKKSVKSRALNGGKDDE